MLGLSYLSMGTIVRELGVWDLDLLYFYVKILLKVMPIIIKLLKFFCFFDFRTMCIKLFWNQVICRDDEYSNISFITQPLHWLLVTRFPFICKNRWLLNPRVLFQNDCIFQNDLTFRCNNALNPRKALIKDTLTTDNKRRWVQDECETYVLVVNRCVWLESSFNNHTYTRYSVKN